MTIDENLGVGLRRSERLIPQHLKPHGYAAGCFGKWNIGFAEGSRPTERGFDEFIGNASGNMDYYTHIYKGRNDLYRGTEPANMDGYSTDLYADAACDFLRRKAGEPFFLYVPFNAVHYPSPANTAPGQPCIWQAPDEYFAKYGYSPDTRDVKQALPGDGCCSGRGNRPRVAASRRPRPPRQHARDLLLRQRRAFAANGTAPPTFPIAPRKR